MDDSWARVGLSVDSDRLAAGAIGALLGRPSDGKGPRWVGELGGPDDNPLDRQIDGATVFIREHIDALRKLAEHADISLTMSWTPRRPQDGIALTPELLSLLSSMRATVRLDTYTD